MGDLLGMSIDNASEHHAVINAKVGVQENFANMSEIIEQTNKLVEENKHSMNQIPMGAIQRITD